MPKKFMICCDMSETVVWTKYLCNADGDLVQRMPGESIDERLKTLRALPKDPKTLEKLWTRAGASIVKMDISLHDWKNQWFVTKVRPHAVQFLELLNEFAEVFLVSNGGTLFQRRVANLLDLPVPLRNVFGCDRAGLDTVAAKADKILLLDDAPKKSMGLHEKLKRIGQEGNLDCCMYVQGWFGDTEDDEELLNLVPHVKEYFGVTN